MFALLLALAAQVASPPPKVWPTHEQDVVLKDFRFRDGEMLPSFSQVSSNSRSGVESATTPAPARNQAWPPRS